MKKVIAILLTIPFLIGCKKDYTGKKITLNKVEQGQLVVVSPEHMFKETFQGKKDAVYYVGDDTCSACAALKKSLEAWCTNYQAIIYEIKWTEVKEDEIKYLEDSTVGPYAWKKENSLPAVYFFMEGEVTFLTDSQTTLDYLMKYVTVE